MTRGQILGILSLLLLCAIAVFPAVAENTTVTTTHDIATDYYNYGELALSVGNFTGAIANFDQALGSNTTMVQLDGVLLYIYHDKSYAQIQQDNYTGAIATLNDGLNLYPTDENLWNNKGYAQYMLGNYADAVNSYNQALASDSNFTTALINKGDALDKQGNYQDAVTAYKAALVTYPNSTVLPAKIADAEKSASTALPITLIAIVIVVIIAGVGIAYYLIKMKPASKNAVETPDKKTRPKKKKSK
ncbi:tetratricopeptide repeat protein [Methanoregula sp.]|jgi:tetratricopeptide (TPR) repeat protein|uniref:tetratricopeptide repeat protein n=1 Tax=Methanoregula sp. TaxID=2052170 RepID=UPI003C1D9F84